MRASLARVSVLSVASVISVSVLVGCSSASTSGPSPTSASASASPSQSVSASATKPVAPSGSMCQLLEAAQQAKPAPGTLDVVASAKYLAYSQALNAAATAATDAKVSKDLRIIAQANVNPSANTAQQTKEALAAATEIAPTIQAECGIDLLAD